MNPYFRVEVETKKGIQSYAQSILDVQLTTELKDINGNVKYTISKGIDSFVSNFVKVLGYLFGIVDSGSLKETNGDVTALDVGYLTAVESSIASSVSNFGIHFGDTTGSSSGLVINGSINFDRVLSSDYSLNKRFSTSSVLYSNTVVSLQDPSTLIITRTLINDNTSQSVYVNEIGLVGKYVTNETSYVLLARDFIVNSVGEKIEVPPNYLLTVKYEIKAKSNNSYTNNFISILYGLLTANNNVTLKAVNGSNVTLNLSSDIFNKVDLNSGANSKTEGIVLNGRQSGTQFLVTPVSYSLPNPLIDTNLSYYATTNLNSDLSTKVGISRIFENLNTSSVIYAVNGLGVIGTVGVSNKVLIVGAQLSGDFIGGTLAIKPLQLAKISFYFNFPAVRDKLTSSSTI
ncbi:MAG: hypothetical protein HPY57_13175 [Ignavibacteria bacterium]|nr:hypothetical protein [Ignavibacteria bacterium]